MGHLARQPCHNHNFAPSSELLSSDTFHILNTTSSHGHCSSRLTFASLFSFNTISATLHDTVVPLAQPNERALQNRKSSTQTARASRSSADMATPTPMKHAPSQQGRTPSGRTPSQLTGATPPVSTPFSAAQAAFSPRNQRSSPQQVKKSPATSMMGQSSMGALNFDSPSTAAAMGALGGFDMGLDGVGGLDGLAATYASEEEKLRRLDVIIKLLNVSWRINIRSPFILILTHFAGEERTRQRGRHRTIGAAIGDGTAGRRPNHPRRPKNKNTRHCRLCYCLGYCPRQQHCPECHTWLPWYRFNSIQAHRSC